MADAPHTKRKHDYFISKLICVKVADAGHLWPASHALNAHLEDHHNISI